MARRRGPSRRTDAQRLRLFCEKVAYTLSRPAALDDTLNARFTLTAGADGATTLEAQDYDEDAVTALLAAFRKFHSENDDVHFCSIAKIVGRYVRSDEELALANEKNRDQWLQLGREGSLNIVMEGQHRAPLDWYDLWVNGFLFHDDPRHDGVLDALDPMILIPARHIMFGMVGYHLRVLHVERNVIKEGFNRGLFPED